MQLKEDLSLVSHPEQGHSALNQQGWNTYFPDPELKISFDVFGVSAEEANLVKQVQTSIFMYFEVEANLVKQVQTSIFMYFEVEANLVKQVQSSVFMYFEVE